MKAAPTRSVVTVEDVLITAELDRRPARLPDFEAESRALVALATVMAESPKCVFQMLADFALELCRAGSAGISVWEPGAEDVFRWRATAGEYAQYLGGTLPRRFSPCGTVLDRGRALLMADPVRAFPYIADLCSPVREVLLVPFHQGGVAVGTVWIVSHTPDQHFDAEDARLITSLTRFAGAAVQVLDRIEALEAAERSLRASEERLQRMVNVDGVGVLLFAVPEGRLIGANDHFLRMFGYARAEVESGELTWRTLTPPEYVEISEAQMVGFAVTGRIGPYEKEYFRKDGSRAWMVFAGASLGDGTVVEYCIDVTDRKRAEADLRDQDRKKDDFIALLAHELRNPLAPIRNGLQVFRLSQDRATRDRSQQVMDRQLAHMVRMIDDLLDVSRIGRNKMDLRRARVSLADVVSSAVETARPVIDEAGHELLLSLPAPPIYLDADLTRLSQVVSNLLTNSAKYTQRGGQVWLEAESQDGCVTVTVRDTGIGIPPESLPNIFDMFSQVDRSIERSTGGLGIGLALVKGLVEMHGGTVTARSEGQGRGSEFIVTLPTLEGVSEAAALMSEGHPVSGAVKRRVLVVDDNRDGAESLAMMLELLGNQVTMAHDGMEAVERAGEFRAEVILMDVGMPRMNGLEATKRIREQPWGRKATIIALTGWGQDADRERSREAGCDGHLVKPVSLSELEKLLAELRPSPTI